MDTFVFADRLGLVLTFLAGILIAPELIGLERIKKADNAASSFFDSLIMRSIIFFNKVKTLSHFYIDLPGAPVLLLALGVSLASWFAVLFLMASETNWGISCLSLILLLAFYFIIARRLKLVNTLMSMFDDNQGDATVLIVFFLVPLYFWTLVFAVVIYLAIWISVNFLAFIVKGLFSLVKYSISGRLEHIIVALGLALYIVGNALQFYATFR